MEENVTKRNTCEEVLELVQEERAMLTVVRQRRNERLGRVVSRLFTEEGR